MKTKRKVRIELSKDTYFVKYVERKYDGNYCAAQFYALDHDIEFVKNWIKSNPKIELID